MKKSKTDTPSKKRGIDKFTLAREYGLYQKELTLLKFKKTSGKITRKASIIKNIIGHDVDMDIFVTSLIYSHSPKKENGIDFETYPISQELLTKVILKNPKQTISEASIRLSEYNDKTIIDNYVVLRFLFNKFPNGVFVYNEEYPLCDNLIKWKPSDI